MTTHLALVLAAALDSPRWKELLDRIESIAVSEPPVIAVDKRIRAAKILADKQPDEARRLLTEATSLTYSFTDPPTRAILFTAIWDQLQTLDPQEAESLIAALPLYAYTAGALQTHLRDTIRKDPEQAPAEFSTLIAAFPRNPTPDDLDQLLDIIQHMGARAPELSRVALDKARAALKDRRFQSAPEVRGHFTTDIDALSSSSPRPKRERHQHGDDARSPNVEGMNSMEIVSLARKLPPLPAIEILLDLIDDDKDLPLPRRVAIAYEALELTQRLKLGDDRLAAQAILARQLYQYGDPPKAAVAARLLAESFEKLYDCESAACVAIKLKESPGDLIYSFAEYLADRDLQPADLGLNHPSLNARMLLLDLEKSITGKRRRFGIF